MSLPTPTPVPSLLASTHGGTLRFRAHAATKEGATQALEHGQCIHVHLRAEGWAQSRWIPDTFLKKECEKMAATRRANLKAVACARKIPGEPCVPASIGWRKRENFRGGKSVRKNTPTRNTERASDKYLHQPPLCTFEPGPTAPQHADAP